VFVRVNKANGLDKDTTFAPSKIDGSAYLDIELVERFKPKLSVTFRLGTTASKHACLLIKLFPKQGGLGTLPSIQKVAK